MTDQSEFVEVQGTAEESAFTRTQLDEMMTLAESGIRQLVEMQREAIERPELVTDATTPDPR